MEDKDNKPQFVIDDDPVVDWPVIVKVPADGGTFNEFQFTVSMHVLSPKEYEQLFADAPGNIKNEGDKAPMMSEILAENVPIFQRMVTGWSGVTDKNGSEVGYTPERLAEQLVGKRGRELSAGLWRAINEIRYGARLGN